MLAVSVCALGVPTFCESKTLRERKQWRMEAGRCRNHDGCMAICIVVCRLCFRGIVGSRAQDRCLFFCSSPCTFETRVPCCRTQAGCDHVISSIRVNPKPAIHATPTPISFYHLEPWNPPTPQTLDVCVAIPSSISLPVSWQFDGHESRLRSGRRAVPAGPERLLGRGTAGSAGARGGRLRGGGSVLAAQDMVNQLVIAARVGSSQDRGETALSCKAACVCVCVYEV